MDLETINLSGLAERSVSEEVIAAGRPSGSDDVERLRELTMTTTPIRVGDDGAVVVR